MTSERKRIKRIRNEERRKEAINTSNDDVTSYIKEDHFFFTSSPGSFLPYVPINIYIYIYEHHSKMDEMMWDFCVLFWEEEFLQVV